MDCCSSNESKETDEDTKVNQKEIQAGINKGPARKEQHHGGGCCCGGGTKGMLLNLILMIVVFIVLSFILRR